MDFLNFDKHMNLETTIGKVPFLREEECNIDREMPGGEKVIPDVYGLDKHKNI